MRLDYMTAAPDGLKPLYALQHYVQAKTDLGPKLLHLDELRASQINGCAFCLHLHRLQLRELGESDIRIDCLEAWEETNLYSNQERAALAWTEAVTRAGETHVTDDIYEEVLKHFDGKALADLTLAIATINVWNRLAISFRSDPALAPALLKR